MSRIIFLLTRQSKNLGSRVGLKNLADAPTLENPAVTKLPPERGRPDLIYPYPSGCRAAGTLFAERLVLEGLALVAFNSRSMHPVEEIFMRSGFDLEWVTKFQLLPNVIA